MYQIIAMSRKKKIKLYMKECTKKELAEMLYECNRVLDNTPPKILYPNSFLTINTSDLNQATITNKIPTLITYTQNK